MCSAFLGLAVRPIYLLALPGERILQEEMFWRYIPFQEFLLGTWVIALGGLVFSISYFGATTSNQPTRRLAAIVENSGSMRLASGLVALAGFGAAIVYVQQTGGLNLSAISTKRVIVNSTAIEQGFQTFGPTLAVGRAGLIASICLYHVNKMAKRRTRVATILVGANLLLPIYASDRTAVILVILQLIVLSTYRSEHVGTRSILIGLAVALLSFQVLSTLRSTGRTGAEFEVSGPAATADSLIYNRSLFDLSKNLHVVRAVGNELDSKRGATLVAAIAGPIPRSIWASKPLVSPGPEIGRKIYRTPVAGIPPGLFAEGYWNFGLAGTVAAALLLGLATGKIDSADPRLLHPFAQVIFVFLLMPLAYNAVASSISGVFLDLLRDSVSLSLLWVLHLFLGFSKVTPQ